MRAPLRILQAAIFLGLAGCVGSVGTSIEGRSVSGHSGIFSFALLHSSPKQATITLGGKTVTVTPTQLTWNDGGQLSLPSSWSSLELDESFGAINVNVDDRHFAKLNPED